jgi:hypothetical protein
VSGRDLTFIFLAPTFKSAHLTFLGATVNHVDSVAAPGWTIGSGLYYCKDHQFKVEERPADSLIVALRDVPAGPMDLISMFVVTGRYGLAVVDGYHTADPAIGPDRLEENDNCEFADRNFAAPATRVDLATPFSESLTIDNPHDIDWIRFEVPGPVAQTVSFRTSTPASLTAEAAGDIDLYVLGIPVAGSPLDIRGASRAEGSAESLSLVLQPGEYYMVVTDFAGQPVPYGLCAAADPVGCSLPAGYLTTAAQRPPRAATKGIRR